MSKRSLRETIRTAQEFLVQAQRHDGGWPYRGEAQSYPEPTCYSLLALSMERMGEWENGKTGMGEWEKGGMGDEIASPPFAPSPLRPFSSAPPPPLPPSPPLLRGLDWLQARVNSQGALTLDGDEEPHWSTSLVVITLTKLRHAEALRARCVQWLLSWAGNQMAPQKETPLNSRLRGWPWISDSFSWVEPTSYAVLALKLYNESMTVASRQSPVAGERPRLETSDQRPATVSASDPSTHLLIDQRVAEAEQLLLDRACVGGGWNYGNRIAFDRELPPFPPTTALAALALQDVPAAIQTVNQSLEALRREVSQHQATLSLALAILCFNAFGQPTDEFVNALLKRQKPDGSWRQAVHLTALAILALESVSGGSNVFKV